MRDMELRNNIMWLFIEFVNKKDKRKIIQSNIADSCKIWGIQKRYLCMYVCINSIFKPPFPYNFGTATSFSALAFSTMIWFSCNFISHCWFLTVFQDQYQNVQTGSHRASPSYKAWSWRKNFVKFNQSLICLGNRCLF